MERVKDILLLAGSAEAQAIAAPLVQLGYGVVALISEPQRAPVLMPAPVHLHDFADEDGLCRLMQHCDAVVDASHGFDAQMTDVGSKVATRLEKPFLSVVRPPWDVGEAAQWRAAPSVSAAVPHIPEGACVFAATGWPSLQDYADFRGDRLLVRQTVSHDKEPPFPFMEFVFGSPPFSKASEKALFKEYGVDLVICRNLGGAPSRPKLEAAKELDLPVILIDKPSPPAGINTVPDAASAVAWVQAL